jgi:PAS domain S-box-containing protein
MERTIEYSRALVSALPEATVIVVDASETVLVAEGKLLDRHGYQRRAVAGRRLSDILPDSTSRMLRARYQEALTGKTLSFDYRTADGQTLCWIQLTPMYYGGSEPAAVTAVIQDVTQRHQLMDELHAERERRLMAEQLAGIGHWELELATGMVSLSDGAMRLLGITLPSELPLAALLERIAPADRDAVIATLGDATDTGLGECECQLLGGDGKRRRVLVRGTRSARADGRDLITGAAIDLTELRAAEQARTESEAIFQQGFDGSPIGMAMTDDGRFTRVNDALCRLLGRTREQLLASTCADVTHPEDVAGTEDGRRRILADGLEHLQLEKRYTRPDGSVINASVHVAPVRGPDGEVHAMFTQIVDLTATKEREAHLIHEAADLERLAMVHAALADDRLVLHAQPIIDLNTGEVVQQELLVRLVLEDGQIVAPGGFLPVAERHGCIREIDTWVTLQAVEMAAAGAPVEVNLSAASVGDAEMLATIRAALQRTGADPSLLVFEVTETALMADVDRGRAFATALRELGCRFALDDFGTGYGTFTYLKHIPIDYLKIDIEFVRDLIHDKADERLVKAIVTMARELGKQTIAEGVEDRATMARLRELGVDLAQGYHIGRPAPIGVRIAT